MATKTVANGLYKPELWSKEMLRNLDDYGVMINCVNRNYEGEIKSAGDTVHIQTPGDVTVGTYVKGTAMTYQDLDGDSQTLVVDQKKYFAFNIEDIDKVQANVELMQTYIRRAKVAVNAARDKYLHSLAVAGVASGNDMGTITVTKSNIYDTCVDLFEKLAACDAIDDSGRGEDGKRPFLILPPKIISIIRKSDEAKHATTLGDEVIRKGVIMQYAGFDIKQSTLLKTNIDADSQTTTTDDYEIICGTNEAITYADQITKNQGLRDKDDFATHVSGLYVYGAKVAQPKCLAAATFSLT